MIFANYHFMKRLCLISFLMLQIGMYAQTENFWTKKADFSGLKRSRAVAFSINDELKQRINN